MLAQTAVHLWTGAECEHNPEKLPERMPLHDLFKRCHGSEPSRRPSASEFLTELRAFKRSSPQARQEQPEDEIHKKYEHNESKISRRAAAVAIAAAEGVELYSPKSPHNMVLTPKSGQSTPKSSRGTPKSTESTKSTKGGPPTRKAMLAQAAARNSSETQANSPAPAARPAPVYAPAPVPSLSSNSPPSTLPPTASAPTADWRTQSNDAVVRIKNRRSQEPHATSPYASPPTSPYASPPTSPSFMDSDIQRISQGRYSPRGMHGGPPMHAGMGMHGGPPMHGSPPMHGGRY